MFVSQLHLIPSKLTWLCRLNARESFRDRGSIVSVVLTSHVVQFFMQTQKMDRTYSLDIRFSTDNDMEGGDDASRTENRGQSSPSE